MASYSTKMTEGSVSKHLITFAVPLLIGNFFQQFYNIVDSIIVGNHLGSDALAAIGATGSITYLFYSICLGLAIGSGILISQFYGADKFDNVKSYIINSAYITIVFGILISVASSVFVEPVLKLLDTPENVIQSSIGYMRITCGGTIAVAMYNWIGSVLRSLGDSRTPLIFLGVANVINVGLDFLFVFGFGWGINGVAWATVIAQSTSAILSILFAFKNNESFYFSKAELRPNLTIMNHCFSTGLPIAMQNAMIAVSMVVLQRVANSFGEVVVAAYTATMRIEQLIQQPFQSLNAAIATFCGQNKGAGHRDRVLLSFRESIKIVLIFSISVFALFILLANPIMRMFVDKPEVIELGANALRMSACFYIALGFIYTTRGLLNGVGDTRYAMLNGIAEVIGRIGFSYVLVNFISAGEWSVWWTTCLTWVFTALFGLWRFKFYDWWNLKPRNKSN